MLAMRIAGRVLSRIGIFAFQGCLGGCACVMPLAVIAFVCGSHRVFLGGLLIGAVTGTISFAMAGAISSKSRDTNSLLAHVTRSVVRPSLRAMLIGAFCGVTSSALMARLLRPTEIAAWTFSGFVCGAIGGFVVGHFYGAINGALTYQTGQTEDNIEYSNQDGNDLE